MNSVLQDWVDECLHPQEAIKWNEFNNVTQCHACGHVFEFQFSRYEGFDLTSAVMQALGAASVSWHPRPEGVFDSDRTLEIGQVLLAEMGRMKS